MATPTDVGRAEPRPRKRRWARRVRRFFAFFFLALILLVVGYILVVNHEAQRRLDATLQELKRRHLPTDLASFRREDVPDTDNAARYFLAAGELALAVPDLPYWPTPSLCEPIDETLALRLERIVERERDFFVLFEKGRKGPKWRYDTGDLWENGRGNHLVPLMRRAANMQQARCLAEQARGRWANALDACEAIFDLNRPLNGEGDCNLVLRRAIIDDMALDGLEQTLSRCQPTAPHLEALSTTIRREADGLDLRFLEQNEIAILSDMAQNVQLSKAREAYRLERYVSSSGYDQMRQLVTEYGVGRPMPSKSTARLLGNVSRVSSMLCPGVSKDMYRQKIEWNLPLYDEAAKSVEAAAQGACRRLAAEQDKASDHASWLRAILTVIRGQACLRVAATALAVESYRLRTGRWPDTLADLPEGVPLDPFDGKVLKYTSTSSGRVIYSIGQNQRDEGGQASRHGDDGDLVFRLFDVERRNQPATTRPVSQATSFSRDP